MRGQSSRVSVKGRLGRTKKSCRQLQTGESRHGMVTMSWSVVSLSERRLESARGP